MKNLKTLILLVFIVSFFPIFLNAQETTYFDLPQEVVNELPTASSDTLDKIYVLNNKYYITQENVIGGTPSYLPLNQDLKGITIYFDYSNWYNACIMNNMANWSTTSYTGATINNSNFKRKLQSTDCLTSKSFLINSGTINYNDNTTQIVSSTSFVPYYALVMVSDGVVNNYATSFIFNDSIFLDSILFEEYYHLFSTTPFESETIYSWLEITEEQVFRVKPTKTYVPSDNLYCYHFVNDNTLRGYVSQPTLNEDIEYYDFNIDYHYRQTTGTETITSLPTCILNTTTDYLYREDILQVLSYFLITALIVIGIPLFLIRALIRRKF